MILLSCFYFFEHDNFAFILAGVQLLVFVKGFFQFKKRLSYLAGLKENGLTEEIVNDDAFVEKWHKISEKGVYRYCLVEGGIPLSLQLTASIFFLGIVFSVWLVPSTGPFDFSQLLLVSCFVGVTTGTAAARYLWSINQKKYSDIMSLNKEQNR